MSAVISAGTMSECHGRVAQTGNEEEARQVVESDEHVPSDWLAIGIAVTCP